MKHSRIIFLICLNLLIISCKSEGQDFDSMTFDDPPFQGTIFLDPDIITEADLSTFLNLSYTGQAARTMFDRRVDDWIGDTPYLFQANYDDNLSIEIQVNSEFDDASLAEKEALKYAQVIGKLPTSLRQDVQTVWIHQGTELFGGGNNNLLIHTGQTSLYEQDGILEETLVHEASHTSLDAAHAQAAGWIAAQEADGNFISTYAQDNPYREDVAETFLLYLALKYRSDRISESLKTTIMETIPNRLAYFDNLSLNMYPIE